MGKSQENLKTIWFEGEMLPNWAQSLNAAAHMCPVTEGTRGWFSGSPILQELMTPEP